MKKRWLAAIAGLLLFLLAGCAHETFQNGTFEAGVGDVPSGWTFSAWKSDFGSVEILSGSDAERGRFVKLTNSKQNKTALSQKVKIKKGAYYRLSGDIRVDTPVTSSRYTFSGAHLSVAEYEYAPAQTFKNTDGLWRRYEVYFQAENLKEVTVELRLGSDGRDSVGAAFFDNVVLEEVDEATAASGIFMAVDAQPDGRSGMTALAALGGALFAAAAALAVLFLAKKIWRGKTLPGGFWLALLLAVAAALRVLLAATTVGYAGDIACFKGWAEHLAERGPWNFYADYAESGGLADYVPGYLYVLWLLGGVGNLFSPESGGMNVLLRFPAIVADVLSAFLIYRMARKKCSETPALVFAALFALNPFILANSAWWGQIESVVTLFTLLAFDALLRKRHCLSLVWFAVGVLFKFQMVFALPVYLAYLVYEWIRHRGLRVTLPVTAALCFVGFYVASLPFTVFQVGGGDVLFPFKLYFRQINTYNSYTMNAFNVYGLFGLNMTAMANPGAMTAVSYTLIALFSAGAIFLLFYARDKGMLPLLAGLLYAAVFLFSVKMHERYLYTGVVLLIFSYLWCRDWRVLALSLGLGVVHYVNIAGILLSKTHNYVNGSALWCVGCAASLLLFAALVWVVIDVCRKRNRLGKVLWKNGRQRNTGRDTLVSAEIQNEG